MKVYYSHTVESYNTEQEDQDVDLMGRLGLNVLNPNSPDIQERIRIMRECGQTEQEIRAFLDQQIDKCEGVAFRGLSDGSIPDEVWVEVEKAQNDRKPVFELPFYEGRHSG